MHVEFLLAENRRKHQVWQGGRIVALNVSCVMCGGCGEVYGLGEHFEYRTLNKPQAHREISAVVRLVDFPAADHFLAWAEVVKIHDRGRNAKVKTGQIILVSVNQLFERVIISKAA